MLSNRVNPKGLCRECAGRAVVVNQPLCNGRQIRPNQKRYQNILWALRAAGNRSTPQGVVVQTTCHMSGLALSSTMTGRASLTRVGRAVTGSAGFLVIAPGVVAGLVPRWLTGRRAGVAGPPPVR
jgi:hypothetical protein